MIVFGKTNPIFCRLILVRPDQADFMLPAGRYVLMLQGRRL
jgi:hypothetical protein